MVVENKEIRLVASDLDGTLLDSEKRLPEGFLPLLEQLLARGVCFVAASGRQYFNMLEYFKTLGERIYFIAENGGVVYYRGRIVMARDMETELWQAVVADVAAKRAGRVILSGGKSAYAAAEDMKDENFARNVNRFFARATVVEKLEPASFDDGICKVAVFAENASETLTYPVLRHFSARANVVLSGPDWVDIMDLNVGKGNALSFIQEKLGIDREETMTFGDYLNDVSLLENSACSYAMKNAHPDLKKIAAAIAPGNDEGCVMKVLEQAFF